MQVQQFIARVAEIFQDCGLDSEWVPGDVIAGAVGVEDFFELGGFCLQDTEEWPGENAVVEVLALLVTGDIEKHGRPFSHRA